MIKLLRLVSCLEGLSLIYLLFCSIYLKRMKGIEEAIHTPGMIHGGLFLAFGTLLLICWIEMRWKFSFVAKAFFSSLIPFGFLWLERQLAKLPKKEAS